MMFGAYKNPSWIQAEMRAGDRPVERCKMDLPRFSNMTLTEIIDWFDQARNPDADYINKMLKELRAWREYEDALNDANKKRPRWA